LDRGKTIPGFKNGRKRDAVPQPNCRGWLIGLLYHLMVQINGRKYQGGDHCDVELGVRKARQEKAQKTGDRQKAAL
jgi:hypothetical protein